MGLSLSDLNPTNWSIGGTTVSDIVNNPIVNPIGVFGSIPVTQATGSLGIGGENGLSYEDQLKIGGVIGGGIYGYNALTAPSAGGFTPLPGAAADPVFAGEVGGAPLWAPSTGGVGYGSAGTAGAGSGAGLGAAGTGASSGWGAAALVGGSVLPSILGYQGAKKMGEAQEAETQRQRELAAQYTAMGAPYRQRLADLYANPEAYMNSPEVQRQVQMGTDTLARSLSTQGNPIGSGNALQQLQNYATEQYWGRLGQERDRMAGYGGLAQYQAAAPNIAAGASGVNPYDIQKYNAIGAGVSNLANLYATPKPSSFDQYWTERNKRESAGTYGY